MNKAMVIVSVVVLSSFASAQGAAPHHKAQPPIQEALTPDFKDAALEAFDAVKDIPSPPGVSETEAAMTKTEANKALEKAHRKVKSGLDRSVYDLLDAYHLFKDISVIDAGMIFDDRSSLATKQKYGEYHLFDLKGRESMLFGSTCRFGIRHRKDHQGRLGTRKEPSVLRVLRRVN